MLGGDVGVRRWGVGVRREGGVKWGVGVRRGLRGVDVGREVRGGGL